jgi:hypothetical protein
MNTPEVEKTKVDIKHTTPVECEKCKCQTFFHQQTVMLRSVSAIMSPSGKAGLLPVPVSFSCTSCGFVNQQFLPPELRDNPIVIAKTIIT